MTFYCSQCETPELCQVRCLRDQLEFDSEQDVAASDDEFIGLPTFEEGVGDEQMQDLLTQLIFE